MREGPVRGLTLATDIQGLLKRPAESTRTDPGARRPTADRA